MQAAVELGVYRRIGAAGSYLGYLGSGVQITCYWLGVLDRQSPSSG
jgi:hypothetical protein